MGKRIHFSTHVSGFLDANELLDSPTNSKSTLIIGVVLRLDCPHGGGQQACVLGTVFESSRGRKMERISRRARVVLRANPWRLPHSPVPSQAYSTKIMHGNAISDLVDLACSLDHPFGFSSTSVLQVNDSYYVLANKSRNLRRK